MSKPSLRQLVLVPALVTLADTLRLAGELLMSIWIYLTVVLGMLMGAATIGIRRLMRRPTAAVTSPAA